MIQQKSGRWCTLVYGSSMTRGIDTACEVAGVDMDLHCFPGATLEFLTNKAKDIFTPSYQPATIIIHGGTINCLRFFGPQVVDAYKNLVIEIRKLCPNQIPRSWCRNCHIRTTMEITWGVIMHTGSRQATARELTLSTSPCPSGLEHRPTWAQLMRCHLMSPSFTSKMDCIFQMLDDRSTIRRWLLI